MGTRWGAGQGAALLALAAACSPPTGGERPVGPRLVVLYSTCTLNKDFLSAYRPEVTFTPNLAAFAADSVVFERHESEAGQSGVAFASIFTGNQADRHGVYHHPAELPEEQVCIGEVFRDAGYDTHFWSGQSMASAELGYGQGIAREDTYVTFAKFTKHAKELGPDYLERTTATGPELDELLASLGADPDRHAFLQINFTITHELYHEYAGPAEIAAFRAAYPEHATPYSAAEIAETLAFFEEHRHLLQLDHPRARRELELGEEDVARLDAVLRLVYRACVHQLDRYFGVFLQKLRDAQLLEESLIAFTADHGETFRVDSEPLHWMHGLQLAPSVLSVPWILYGPGAGIEPGRHAEVTRSIDVFPTLAGLADLPLERRLEPEHRPQGYDLSEVLRGRRAAPELLAYSHTTTLGPDRIARYRRNGYGTVLSLLPEADPIHMWVRVRDGDLVFEQRPFDPRDPEGSEAAGGAARTLCFDLAQDPGRTRDLFDAGEARHRERAEGLTHYRQRLIRGFSGNEGLDGPDALSRLQGLGYISDE